MSTFSLANLVVSLEANIAKFSTDMKSAAQITQQTMSGISSAIEGAKQQFISLTASVVSVGAVVKSVQAAIHLGDELKTLSDATGIAVEKLDQLAIVAKLNNANAEDLVKGFKGVRTSLVEAQDASSKAGQLFGALGVTVKDATGNLKSTDVVMGEVADALNTIDNETTRAAVGTAIFGRSYLQIAATLRNYREDQEKANQVLEKFGSVSTNAAKLADDLGDNFTLLGEGSRRALLNGLVPGMAAVGQAIQELINSGSTFQRSFGDVISKVATFVAESLISLKGAFQVVGVTVAAVLAAIATQSLEPFKALKEDIAKIEGEVLGAQARIKTAAQFPGLDNADQVSRAAGAYDRLNKAQADTARLNAILAQSGSQVKAVYADYTAEILHLENEINKISGSDGGMTRTAAALEKITKDMLDGKIVSDAWIDALLDAARAADEQALRLKASSIEAKALAEGLLEADRQEKAMLKSVDDLNKSLEEQNKVLDLEHATLLLSNTEKDLYVAKAKLIEQANAGNTEGVRLLGEQIDKLNRKLADESFVRYVEAWSQALQTVSSGLQTFFVDLVNNGSSAFKKLWDSFRQFALSVIAEIAAKQVVVSIVGALGLGGAGGAAASSNLLQSGSTGLLNTLLNSVGNASSIGAIGSAFSAGYAGANVSAATLGAGAAAEVGSAAAGEVVAGGLISGLEAGLAAVPVAGWVALGALIIGGIVSKSGIFKGGGPQTREFGTAGADISAFGDFATVHKLVGTDAVQTSAFNQAAATELATYNGVLKALGVRAPAAAFALYSSQDTKGTAQSSADIRATVGGNLVYSANLDQSLGRDPAALQARIQLEASRAVLAALQASVASVPKFIGDLIKSVDAATATQEQIDNITKVAVALKQAADLIPQVSDALTNLDPKSIQGLVDAVGGVDEFSNAMKFLSDNFSLSADKANEAQKALTDGFAALNLKVPETHQQFLDLLNSFDLTTESGRKAYASVLALSGAFVAVKGTADQAAEATRAQAEANRQAIGSLRDAQLGFAQSTATSPLAQAQLQLAHDQQETNDLIQQFIADKPWAQQFVAGGGNLAQLLVHIDPADFVKYSDSDQKVILALINHAAAINKDSQSIVDASNNVASSFNDWQASLERAQEDAAALQNATQQGQQFANNFIQQAQQFAGQQPGADFGQKLSLEMQYIATQLAALRANPAQFGFQSRLSADYRAAISTLQSTDAALLASLNLFNQLKVRYGASIAEQLVNITDTYKQQAAALAGNAAGLALLNQTFEDQWNAIINGTASGVSGVQDQLTKLRQNILDYVDSLKISNLSPLTPAQKLAEAQQQYQTTLTAAQGGDQTALQNITTSAGNLLDLARDFYASSPAYTNLFNQITSELTALGTAGSVGAPPMNEADQALLNALPTDSQLMSAADMQAVIAFLSGTGTSAAITQALSTLPLPVPATPQATTLSANATTTGGSTGTSAATTVSDTSVVEATVQQTAAITSTQQTTANQIIAAVGASGAQIIEALTVGQK